MGGAALRPAAKAALGVEQMSPHAESDPSGAAGGTSAGSGSGDLVSINGASNFLAVPVGYISVSPLSNSSIYNNTNFSILGAIPGTYVWNWAPAYMRILSRYGSEQPHLQLSLSQVRPGCCYSLA